LFTEYPAAERPVPTFSLLDIGRQALHNLRASSSSTAKYAEQTLNQRKNVRNIQYKRRDAADIAAYNLTVKTNEETPACKKSTCKLQKELLDQ
jgi:hypothetical protein